MKYLNTLQDKAGKNVNVDGHKHTKGDITDFPSSLPANGGNANSINYLDTRSVNHNGFDYKGITTHLKYNSTDGLNDGGTYHGVVHMTQWGDISGGRAHQFGFSDNGNVWYRDWNGTVWSSWIKLAKVTDIPTKLSQITNDVGFTKNALIQTVANTAPTAPVVGQVWIQTY
ncbi:hypothetical protein JCM1393_21630 [Clostridium carnis]